MREPHIQDKVFQLLLAALMLVPLMIAFKGGGGFADAYGTYLPSDGDAVAARHEALLLAGGRSIAIGLLATLVALVIGIPAAWVLAQRSMLATHGRGVWWLVLCALPLVLPASVTVSGWVAMLAPEGVASRFKVPIPNLAANGALFSLWGAAFVLGTMLWPLIAFEAWPAFRRARNEAYEAALLYTSRNRAFLGVIVPQAKGEIAAGALLVFLLACSDFSVSSLLLVRTLPTEIHDSLMVGKTASAGFAALPLIVTVFFVAVGLSRLSARRAPAATSDASLTAPAAGKTAHGFLLGGVLLGFVLPMIACLYSALNVQKPMSAVFGAGSDSIATTVRLAGAAALISIFAAVARLLLWPELRARAVNAAGLFLLAVPGSFLAAALLAGQQEIQPVLESVSARLAAALPAAVLALGFVVRFIYIPLRLVEEGLASLDPDLLDAAALAGHSRFSRAISIALPLVLPHIAAATALVFILSLGEVPMSARLAPPGVQPATVWLFQQQHLGYDEAVFGLSLLLGAVAALILVLAGALTALGVRVLRAERKTAF